MDNKVEGKIKNPYIEVTPACINPKSTQISPFIFSSELRPNRIASWVKNQPTLNPINCCDAGGYNKDNPKQILPKNQCE